MVSLSKTLTLMLVTLFLSSLAALPLAISVASKLTWNIETVDKNNVDPGSIILAFDHNNSPCLAYDVFTYGSNFVDSGATHELMFAKLNGSSWEIQTVILGAICMGLALDRNDNPHILYRDIGYGVGIKYASWTGSNWTFQTVDEQGSLWGALALDSAANPHVAYIGANNYLKYASWTTSGWNIQTLEQTIDSPVSLALDSTDNPHVLYETGKTTNHQTSYMIRYAVWDTKSGFWNYQSVIANASFVNLVLDSNNIPHFASVNHQSSAITYLSLNGSIWEKQTVLSSSSSINLRGGYLALDSKNIPHLDYFALPYPEVKGKLVYASYNGVSWDCQTLDSNATGPGPVAIDSHGNPKIAYLGNISDLKVGIATFAYLMYASSQPKPTPTSTPTSTAFENGNQMLIVVIVIVFVSAALAFHLLYRRHRKIISRNKPNV